MLIKKYLDFITESSSTEQSFGEWVESLSDDPEIMRIVNRYINDSSKIYGGDDISPTIRLSNSINLLDTVTQNEIKSQIEKYLQHGIVEKDADILASTQIEKLKAGRGVFSSFLKTFSALGLKDSSPNWKLTPNEMLFYWESHDLDFGLVSQIFGRFRSLQIYFPEYSNSSTIKLYFGVKCSGILEYGLLTDKKLPIGEFKLNKSNLDWISNLGLKSAQSLKNHVTNLTPSDIKVLGDIKTDLQQWSPGYYESRSNPNITDRVISFGFYGFGKWDNGQLQHGELENIKSVFVEWLMTKKWAGKVLISLKANSFWLYIHLKLK